MLSSTASWAASASSHASSVSAAVSASTSASKQGSAIQRRWSFPTPVPAPAARRSNSLRDWWLHESFLAIPDQYERIATATPRITVAVLGYHLIEQHINMRPQLTSPADFAQVYHGGRDSRAHAHRPEAVGALVAPAFVGVRPKLHTWPMNRKEKMHNKVWNV